MEKKEYKCKYCGKIYFSYKEDSNYCSRDCRNLAQTFIHQCEICGKDVRLTKTPHEKYLNGEKKHIYCSRECADKGRVTRVKKNCEYCGKEFEIFKCFSKEQKFCSMDCYDKSRGQLLRLETKTCPVCGKDFTTYHHDKIFCSADCFGKSIRKRATCVCATCGKTFERKESEVNKWNKHYCSNACRFYAISNQEWYKGLSEFMRGRLTSWTLDIKRQNNFTCCLTGSRSNIVVHHCRGFNLLINETIDILNFPQYETFGDYSEEELDKFISTFMELQDKYNAYCCVTESVHKLFHSEYGYGDNTEEQWNEFVQKYKNGYYSNIA